jgi:hypothetical protein
LDDRRRPIPAGSDSSTTSGNQMTPAPQPGFPRRLDQFAGRQAIRRRGRVIEQVQQIIQRGQHGVADNTARRVGSGLGTRDATSVSRRLATNHAPSSRNFGASASAPRHVFTARSTARRQGAAMSYPVHYSIERPLHFTRLQLLVRLVAFCALGLLGLSFGLVFMFAYLALPVFASVRAPLAPAEPTNAAAPSILEALRWFAAVSAWAALISDRLPGDTPDETVALTVDNSPRTSSASPIWRVLTGLPSALVLGIVGWLGIFVWMWAALSVLLFERVGHGAFAYLVGVQRWSIRLLAYQGALVDEYPPFSFADAAPPALPTARIQPQ